MHLQVEAWSGPAGGGGGINRADRLCCLHGQGTDGTAGAVFLSSTTEAVPPGVPLPTSALPTEALGSRAVPNRRGGQVARCALPGIRPTGGTEQLISWQLISCTTSWGAAAFRHCAVVDSFKSGDGLGRARETNALTRDHRCLPTQLELSHPKAVRTIDVNGLHDTQQLSGW